jgi:hypothetical protein
MSSQIPNTEEQNMEVEMLRMLNDVKNKLEETNTRLGENHLELVENFGKLTACTAVLETKLEAIEVQTTLTNGTVKGHERFNNRLVGLSLIGGLVTFIISVFLYVYLPKFLDKLDNSMTTTTKLEIIHKQNGELKP